MDDETGEVDVLRYVAAHDLGRVVNPRYAEGQISGGVVQGIGQALFEEITYRDGVVANPNLTDYKLPTMADVPPIEAVLVERASSSGPYGAKGIGEPPIMTPPACIANAIADASGARVRHIPMTAERVWRALRDTGD